VLREGQEAGNEERRRRGWDEIDIAGWARPPYYDSATHNLTWSTRIRSKSDPTDETVNHSVRLLGRGGVMNADLVIDPKDLSTAVPTFDRIVAGYAYHPGSTYAEWREGDKVAEYGLTALIAGGAGAAAMKLGFFGKLWKVILAILIAGKKLVFVIVVAAVGVLRSLFGGGKKSEKSESPAIPRR